MGKLLKKSIELTKKIEILIEDLGFERLLDKGENLEIYGSVKYNLFLEGFSDVDIWIKSDNPRESFEKKADFFVNFMKKNKFCKKMILNNFFDDYSKFYEKKNKLSGVIQKDKFFMIELDFYLDEYLEKKIKFQIHISDKEYQEQFSELLSLLDSEKENLLEIKNYVYTKLPFFWNRSTFIYEGFLKGFRDIDGIKKFLKSKGKI